MQKAQLKLFKEHYAKPFLKWVGGKTQLIPKIEKRLPENIMEFNKALFKNY